MPLSLYLSLLLAPLAHTSTRPSVFPAELKTVTACETISAAEIAQAIGIRVGNAKEERDSAGSTCEFRSGGGHVTVALRHSPAKLDVDSEIENIHAALPHAKLRDVNGIGTRAFFFDMDTAGTQLNVLRGEHDCLLVSMLGFGDAEQVSEAVEKIARLAIGRL
ncbi:MAG: hypothetical protein ABSH09_27440 [Bryobacteraceae bacterium]|jgi:hypothetical protein